MKKGFFHLKDSFRFRNIQFFVFRPPLILPAGHCFREWSKIINLKRMLRRNIEHFLKNRIYEKLEISELK